MRTRHRLVKLLLLLAWYCACNAQSSKLRPQTALVRLRGGSTKNHGVSKRQQNNAFLDSADTISETPTSLLESCNIESLTFLRSRGTKIDRRFHLLMGVLWISCIGAALSSAGKPYTIAMREAFLAHVASNGLDLESMDDSAKDTILESIYEAAEAGSVFLPLHYLPDVRSLLALTGCGITHALIVLAQRWSIRFRTLWGYEKLLGPEGADAVLIKPVEHYGHPAISVLRSASGHADVSNDKGDIEGEERSEAEHKSTAKDVQYFEFQRRRFVRSSGEFEPIPLPSTLQIKDYMNARGLDDKEVTARRRLFGLNTLKVEAQKPLSKFIDTMLQPFSVIYFVSQLLNGVEQHWMHTLTSMFVVLVQEGMAAHSAHVSAKQIYADHARKGGKIMCVWRNEQWQDVPSEELLPGDVVSLCAEHEGHGGELPADMLILRGAAVVDEATLTGESTPVTKVSLLSTAGEDEETLDMVSKHKNHVLFGGTSLISTRSGEDEEPPRGWRLPLSTPNNGCLVYITRTGSYSTQGNLLRMIEYGARHYSMESRDAGYLMATMLTFSFASMMRVVFAAAHQKGETGRPRSSFYLLVQCCRILTSAVPTEIHSELARRAAEGAKNLLTTCGVGCTEPSRLPAAGHIDIALFDKTGTITTDQLSAAALVVPKRLHKAVGKSPHAVQLPLSVSSQTNAKKTKNAKMKEFHKLEIGYELAAVVLGGCHSLGEINNKLLGDPLEVSALASIGWMYNATTSVAAPVNASGAESVHIWHRYSFESELQRMSVVAEVNTTGSDGGVYILTKGSPEALLSLMDASSVPTWYQERYLEMAGKGIRVLALACRQLLSQKELNAYKGGVAGARDALRRMSRSEVEAKESLRFVGFVEFESAIRSDSAATIHTLETEAGVSTAIVTGDSCRTAEYVAREIGMISDRTSLLLTDMGNGTLSWKSLRDIEVGSSKLSRKGGKKSKSRHALVRPFRASKMRTLAKKYALCVEGPVLDMALKLDPDVFRETMDAIKVFARVTPEQKEMVVSALKGAGHRVLFCGDGANDVGALRQAHVGVALLSGFGSSNTGQQTNSTAPLLSPAEARKKAREERIRKAETLGEDIMMEARKLHIAAGGKEGEEPGLMLRYNAFRMIQKREIEAASKLTGSFAEGAKAFGDENDDLDIRTGDATMAAPFTSKKPSISAAVDVVRQGRCTSAIILQTFQICALGSLFRCFSLSSLYVDNFRFSHGQALTLSILMDISYYGIQKATPLPDIHPVRPASSIRHPSILLSVIGQFIISILASSSVMSVVRKATISSAEHVVEGATALVSKRKFEPNLVSDAVFLMSVAREAGSILANYKGVPFMTALAENHLLVAAICISALGAPALLLQLCPSLSKTLEMSASYSTDVRRALLAGFAATIFGSVAWDRAIVRIFDPQLMEVRRKEKLLTAKGRRTVLVMLAFVVFVGPFYLRLVLTMLDKLPG